MELLTRCAHFPLCARNGIGQRLRSFLRRVIALRRALHAREDTVSDTVLVIDDEKLRNTNAILKQCDAIKRSGHVLVMRVEQTGDLRFCVFDNAVALLNRRRPGFGVGLGGVIFAFELI
ncbi:MAG: hypothetical protein RMN52_02310 [Anaerolineae bacterium]|nr:hypothetical protein [Candidatus Roseilinea sp.]MDW8448814.1 hypothetical protein [Anaerolineae bacterium]